MFPTTQTAWPADRSTNVTAFKRWLALVIAIVAAIAVGLVMPGGAKAQAAAFLVCQPINGAPSITRLSNGIDLKGYYYHGCNTNPASLGATSMHPIVYIEQYDPDGWRVYSHFDRGVIRSQTTAAYNTVLFGYKGSHYFRTHMKLTISGSFSYGAVPGCGRANSTTVVCNWYSAQKFYGG